MKKIILTIVSFVLISTNAFAEGKLKIVATLPVFGSIAQAIGGDKVEVKSLAKSNMDPHFIDAKPTYAVLLNQADLVIEGGLGLESGWLPSLLLSAKNPKIMQGAAGYVDLSKGITALDVSSGSFSRAMGDVHPQGNPHTWLDPRNAKIFAVNIANILAANDPANKDYYQSQLKLFIIKLNNKIGEWEILAKNWQGKKIVTYHKSFSYFANWLKLDVVNNVESKPGIPPSMNHIDKLIAELPAQHVSLLLIESFYPKNLAQTLADKTKLPLLVVETDVDGVKVNDYFSLIDQVIKVMAGHL